MASSPPVQQREPVPRSARLCLRTLPDARKSLAEQTSARAASAFTGRTGPTHPVPASRDNVQNAQYGTLSTQERTKRLVRLLAQIRSRGYGYCNISATSKVLIEILTFQQKRQVASRSGPGSPLRGG